jgi:GWxTD domain-containing protein
MLLVFACQTNRQYTTRPTKSLINPNNELLEVNALAFHLNDSITRIHLKINNENLLYKRPDTTKAFYSEMKVFYKVISEPNSKIIVDSGSFYLKDRSEDETVTLKSVYSQFSVKAIRTFSYYLELDVFDINRKIKYKHSLELNKKSKYSAQNFLVTLRDTIVFKNNFSKNEEVRIRFTNPQLVRAVVQCYFKELGPALPPFSTKASDESDPLDIGIKADSIFAVQLSINQLMLTMPEKGFYHVVFDPKGEEGVNLFTYDDYFPGVGTSNEMIDCTRYIMSKEEFEACKSAEDQKACIDRFWLNIAGSNERARELLKRYYGRVKEANKNYTSFTQGWKTDRGMVFIIFGSPTNIYRSKKDEIWVYGNEANPNGLRFVFNKKVSPYSNKHFVMERSQFYKDNWYTAVEMWRQGQIYSEGSR